MIFIVRLKSINIIYLLVLNISMIKRRTQVLFIV